MSPIWGSHHPIGSYNIPEYKTGTGENEEHYTAFVHSSTTKEHGLSINLNGKTISGTMPAKDVTINIVYSINQYTVTFVHKDAVLGTNTFGGTTHTNNTYELFNGENVKIPYKEIENFKVVSHNTDTQSHYTLDTHSDKEIEILYQQINFNLSYNENGGSTCTDGKTEYKKEFGTLCNTSKQGYQFSSWKYNQVQISDDVVGDNRFKSSKVNNYYNDITLDANWNKNKYYVRYYCNGGIPTTSYESEHYYDTESTLADNQCSKTGFAFSKWTHEGGAEPTYTNKQNIMNLTDTNLGTVKLYATYSPYYLTVIYNPKDATSIKFEGNVKTEEEFKNESKSKYYYNVLTDTGLANVQNNEYIYLERKGYKSTGYWYNETTKLDEKTEVSGKTLAEHFGLDISNGNKTLNLYPEWEIINYTITYNLNSGTNPSGAKTEYTIEDSEYTLPTPTRTGYTFEGWYETSDFTGSKVTKITKGSTGNKTYYAKWTIVTYSITYNLNSGTQASNPPTSYTVDTATFNLPTPTKTGYTFDGWYASFDFSGTKVTQIAKGTTGNKTYYAKWKTATYSITYNLNSGTQASNPPTSYTVETATFNLPTPTRTGYSFEGWYTSSDFSGTKVTQIAKGTTGNKTYYAKWKEYYVKVVYHPTNATTIQFKGVGKDESTFENETIQYVYYDTNEPSGLANVQNANWIYLSRTGYNSTGNWYNGQHVINQSTAVSGKTLATKFGIDISTGNKTLDVYPEWSAKTYVVKYDCGGGEGTIAEHTATYDSNFSIKASSCTKLGYTFAGWTTKTDNSDDKYNWTGWSGKWTYVDGQYGISNGILQLYARWETSYVDEWVEGEENFTEFEKTGQNSWASARFRIGWKQVYNEAKNQSYIKITRLQAYSKGAVSVVWIGGDENETKGIYTVDSSGNETLVKALSHWAGDAAFNFMNNNLEQWIELNSTSNEKPPWDSIIYTHNNNGELNLKMKVDLRIVSKEWPNQAYWYNVSKDIELKDLRP